MLFLLEGKNGRPQRLLWLNKIKSWKLDFNKVKLWDKKLKLRVQTQKKSPKYGRKM